uniref:Uncharacterized protein n=1 Tax=Tanacetum cinerariifolium TaxID=118510 RepID=A0A699IXD6_TANCI|nr:hypothetical protein [Tanacetum cinerariifolium]
MLQICPRLPGQKFEESWIPQKLSKLHLDDALDTPANRLKIRKCNHRLSSNLKSNKPTLQVQKTKYKKKADEPITCPKSKNAFASKGTRLKSKAKVNKPDMKKQLAKKTKAKGLVVLSKTEYEEEDVDERVRTSSDYELTGEEKLDDEKTMDDEVIKELYDDVNVNLGNDDTEMTDSNQGEPEMFELKQTNQFIENVSLILRIIDKYLTSKMKEAVNVDSTMKTIIKDQVKAQVSKIMPKIEKYVTESLGAKVLVRSTNQPQTAYAVAASLSKFELKKILIDKMEANKSINRSNTQKNLYNALVESYNSDKDIITSYGDVVLLKRGRDDQDKDEDPSAGSDQGTKRRKSAKDAETSKDSRRYSTSVTKTKAATYNLKWIEDLVPELLSPVVVKYDQHAYFGTSH